MSLMKEMLQAGVHFGHKKAFCNPQMNEFIFGINHGIHIINLEKTVPLFQDAVNFVGKTVANCGKVMFVGTKRQAQEIIETEATRCGMPFVSHRWLGGMLTNYKTVKQSIRRLSQLEKMRDDGTFESLTKKETLQNTRTIAKLEKVLGGIKEMGGIPDAIVVIDSNKEHIAIQEAQKLGIKVVSVVDTNSNPEGIDYIIPGNDDAVKAISFYMSKFADAIIDSQGLDKALEAKGDAAEVKQAEDKQELSTMSNISSKLVKDLRERTGAGMMECKKALVASEGDIEKAAEEMRISGQAEADKKASRVAAEGVIEAYSADGRAVLIEINSETDFVARDDSFKAFAAAAVKASHAANAKTVEEVLEADMGGQTVEEARKNLVATMGENIQVRRMKAIESLNLGAYIHGGKIGVVAALEGGEEDLAKDVAMHIAAVNPLVVSGEDVPADIVQKEKDIFTAQAQESGKPAEIIEKMIGGRIRKFLDEVSLLGQSFVKNPDLKVEQLVKQHNAKVVSFIRLDVGEGIEKKEEDFAAEVMNQIKG